jgi:hypothetical protein
VPVNPGTLPGTLPGSAIEIRIAEWDLISIATTQDDGDDEHAYDAQKGRLQSFLGRTTSTLNPPSSTDARRA